MTGATGFVGSHFLLRWSTRGERAIALARASSHALAGERVARALSDAAASLALPPRVPRAQALASDLSKPRCGLDAGALRDLLAQGVTESWHFAASLQYEERHRADIFEANVEGTRRALELAHELGCTWFVHVSTAYTAGQRTGRIAERLPAPNTRFHNCYEASKAEAEQLVARFCVDHGLRYAILRPSIVVGPHCSKSTGGSSTGLYGFAREIGRARAALGALGRPLWIRGEPETPLNLLPVDWFVEDVTELLASGPEESFVSHHTLDGSPTIRHVGEVLAELLALPGFEITPEPTHPVTPLESLLARRTAFYGSYLSGAKHFERARPLARRLSLDDLREYLAASFAQSQRLSKAAPLVIGEGLGGAARR
jgi:nucleoside-diphosphate-sugar epimerase